jgi:hypothetical protein
MKKKTIIALTILALSAFVFGVVILPDDPQPPKPNVVLELSQLNN